MTLLGRPQMGSIDFTKIEARIGEHIRQAEKRAITEPDWMYTPALGQHTTISHQELGEGVGRTMRWPSPEVKTAYYRQVYRTSPEPIILTKEEFDALYLVSPIPSEADTKGQED